MEKDPDTMGSTVLSLMQDAIGDLLDAFFNQAKLMFLYKYINLKHKELVSRFLDGAITENFDVMDPRIKNARYFWEGYKKTRSNSSPLNNNVFELASLADKQIESSMKLLVGIKRFYQVENEKAKSKG